MEVGADDGLGHVEGYTVNVVDEGVDICVVCGVIFDVPVVPSGVVWSEIANIVCVPG